MNIGQKPMLAFETRTGSVHIDLARCEGCETYACVEACKTYGAGIFRLTASLPALKVSIEDASKQCIECLACELACQLDGQDAVQICLPIPGLEKVSRGDSI